MSTRTGEATVSVLSRLGLASSRGSGRVLRFGGGRPLCRVVLAIVAVSISHIPRAHAAGRGPGRQVEPVCSRLALSPTFGEDGTAFCAGELHGGLGSSGGTESFVMFRSSDGGVSWTKVPAEGLTPLGPLDQIGQLFLSPVFQQDRRIFVRTAGGIYVSTDDGRTFIVADPAAPYDHQNDFTVALDPATPGRAARGVGLYASSRLSSKIDPPLRTPIVGAAGDDKGFFFGPSRSLTDAYVVARDGSESVVPLGPLAVYGCEPSLLCVRRLWELPAGHDFVDAGSVATAGEHPMLYVVTRTTNFETGQSWPVIFRSLDGGATFVPWRALNDLVTDLLDKGRFEPTVSIAENPALADRVYVLISAGPPLRGRNRETVPPNPPAQQLFLSIDGGQRFERVNFALGYWQRGQRGALPWNDAPMPGQRTPLAVADDGRMFALGTTTPRAERDSSTVFCSVDAGKTWRRFCPTGT